MSRHEFYERNFFRAKGWIDMVPVEFTEGSLKIPLHVEQSP